MNTGGRGGGAGGDEMARWDAYFALVREWSGRLDLVGPGELEIFRQRHVEDSLRLLPLVRSLPAGTAVDVGSGAGLPGVPLAIADPTRRWRLLEPRAKRAAFLEEVVRALELSCEVVIASAEQAAADERLRAGHVLATARALAPPAQAFDLLMPLVAPGGVGAVFVGQDACVPPEAEMWAPGIAIVDRRRSVNRE